MASSKDFLDYVREQLSDLDGVSFRPMMGEYVLYFHGKVVGGIYDDCLLVKPTQSAKSMRKAVNKAVFFISYHSRPTALCMNCQGSNIRRRK